MIAHCVCDVTPFCRLQDRRPPVKRPLCALLINGKTLNKYEFYTLYYVSSSVVGADYRTPQLTSKQQFVCSLRAWFFADLLQRIPRQTSQRHAFGRRSMTGAEVIYILYSIVTHAMILAFSLSTMQLGSYTGFVGPSCLIHICNSNY